MRIEMGCTNKACGWTFTVAVNPDVLVVQHEVCPKCGAQQKQRQYSPSKYFDSPFDPPCGGFKTIVEPADNDGYWVNMPDP